jgi:hypothetical protein
MNTGQLGFRILFFLKPNHGVLHYQISIAGRADCMPLLTSKIASSPTATTPEQPPPPAPTPISSCADDCLAIITQKLNGLKDQVCTGDNKNDWVDSGYSSDRKAQWWRLASHNNCYLVLTQDIAGGTANGQYCFSKNFLQNLVFSKARNCDTSDFFQASPVQSEQNFQSGRGLVCLTDFNNYRLCGSTTKNGGTISERLGQIISISWQLYTAVIDA